MDYAGRFMEGSKSSILDVTEPFAKHSFLVSLDVPVYLFFSFSFVPSRILYLVTAKDGN